MKKKIFICVYVVVIGGLIGSISHMLGYGATTWQYYAFTLPACFVIGVFSARFMFTSK